MDEGAASRNANDVLILRAQLKSLVESAVIANNSPLETEKTRVELHNQIEQIEQRLYPKRAHSHDDVGDAHEILSEVDRQQATRVQNRRNVQHGSRDNLLGLIGWIQYWCCGDAALTVVMLVSLINVQKGQT